MGMGISQTARRAMEDFAQRLEEPFGLCSGKVPAQEGVASLIVGIGGAGCNALLETKGMIGNACCLSAGEKDRPPFNVAYLCLDTDVNSREKRSSAGTGRAGLKDREFVHLYSHGSEKIPAAAMPPYIREWLDPDRFPVYDLGMNGSGGIRQNGRLLLFLNADRVFAELRRAVHEVLAGTRAERLNIYVMAGLGGGTGSGAFLDVAYLARKAAEEMAPDLPATVFGYLFAPDVHIRRAVGEENKARLYSNSYAALRELDRVMAVTQSGGVFEQNYGAVWVSTSRPPFDFVHFIGAVGEAGVPADPYGDAMRTVAQSILPFVAQERPRSIGPLTMVRHYHEVKAKGASVPAAAGTCGNYLVPGTAEYALPTDKFLRVAFGKVLKKIKDLFVRRPAQQEVEQACCRLGLKPDQLRQRLLNRKPDFLPENCRWADVFGANPRFDVRELYGRWMNGAIGEVRKNGERFLDAFPEQLRCLSDGWFTDPACGPAWLAALLASDSGEDDLPGMLEKSERAVDERLGRCRGEMELRRRMAEELGRTAAAALILTRERKTQEFVGALYNYALLCAETEALERMRDIYRSCIRWLRAEGRDCCKPVADMLVLLWDICEHDGEALENAGASAIYNGRYTGRPFTAADARHLIDRTVGATGNERQTMADFIRILHRHMDRWSGERMGARQIGGMDVRGFVRDYLEEIFGGLAACTFRDAINIHVQVGDVTDSVRRYLAPDLVRQAEQQINRTAAGAAAACWIFSVPEGCPAAEEGMRAFGAASLPADDVTVQLSKMEGRVLVQCVRYGLSLSDLNCMPLCERYFRMAAGAGHTAGLFLRREWKEAVCAEL